MAFLEKGGIKSHLKSIAAILTLLRVIIFKLCFLKTKDIINLSA